MALETVRDKAELAAAIVARAGTIEVRGTLAHELLWARTAAGLALTLAGLSLVVLGVVMGVALWSGHGETLGTKGSVFLLFAVLLLGALLMTALRRGGAAALRTLHCYRTVHRGQGSIVLRRK